MKKRFLLMVLIIFILTTIGYSDSYDDTRAFRRQSATTKTYQKKVALVMGNDEYQTSPLSNAVDDAVAMKRFLENHGFEVIFLENGTTAQMRDKIASFSDSITSDSISLVYYSGHGTQEKSRVHGVRNYLIPVDDARIKRVTDLDEFAISLDYILNPLVEKNNGLNIVMLDACRTSMRAFSKSRSGGLSPSQAQGVYIAYATASNTTARDDSLFRKSFIKHASRPLKLIDIFEEVKMDVYDKTGQNPFTSNGKRGAFYFTAKEKVVIPTPEPQQSQPEVVYAPTYVEPITQTSTSKWITPTENKATWEKAKKICRNNGGRLPTLEELKKVVTDCGGEMKDKNNAEYKRNKNNNSYQNCYKEKGFNDSYDSYYWSSTSRQSHLTFAWLVYFGYGYTHGYLKVTSHYVHCVRAGQ